MTCPTYSESVRALETLNSDEVAEIIAYHGELGTTFGDFPQPDEYGETDANKLMNWLGHGSPSWMDQYPSKGLSNE